MREPANISFLSVYCPVCGKENEIDSQLERFFCFSCGKRVLTEAAIAFSDSMSMSEAGRIMPATSSDDDFVRASKRAMTLLENGRLERALPYCKAVQDYDTECTQAYAVRQLASLQPQTHDDLLLCKASFASELDLDRANVYADQELATILDPAKEKSDEVYTNEKQVACEKDPQSLSPASTPQDYRCAAREFKNACDYVDACERIKDANGATLILEEGESCKAETYKLANRMMMGVSPGGLEQAAKLFDSLGDWKDSKAQAEECRLRLWDYRFINNDY